MPTTSPKLSELIPSNSARSYEQFRVDNPFAYLNNGYYYFAGGTGGGGLYSSGDPYLDFELGIPDGYEQTSNGFIDALAAETYAYAQDSWKVSPDLTLNYGISWDVEYPNQNDQFSGLGINCWSNSTQNRPSFPARLQDWPSLATLAATAPEARLLITTALARA